VSSNVQLFHVGTVERVAVRRLDLVKPIKEFREAGMSVRAIASATGISPTTVQKILNLLYEPDEHGMIRAWKAPGLDGKERLNRQVDTTDRDTHIRKLRATGKSIRAIAVETRCSVGTVHRVINRIVDHTDAH
jgi:DNA invertase Pin-like site-specific DNA recombinase